MSDNRCPPGQLLSLSVPPEKRKSRFGVEHFTIRTQVTRTELLYVLLNYYVPVQSPQSHHAGLCF